METLMVGRLNASMFLDDLSIRRIPVPDQQDIIAIRDDLIKTNPQFFADPTTEADLDWLQLLGLAPMYHYRFNRATDMSLKGVSGSFRMQDDPRMSKYMHVLLFAAIPLEDVAMILNAKYNIAYDDEDYGIFAKFFGNYEGWSYSDREFYSDQITDQDLRKLYKMAIKGDRGQLIWELGLGPDPNLSFDDLLRDMFTDSYFYFKRNIKLRPDDAQKFAALAVKISDRLESIDDKNKDAQDFLQQMKVNLQTESTKPKAKEETIIDLKSLDIEMPASVTSTSIPDLDHLMSDEKIRDVFDGDNA
jgi:hypothetical protein